jgi:beta-xylosidase
MTWREDGWPVIGVDKDGDGKGEPVRTWRKPKTDVPSTVEVPPTSDEFDSPRLGLQWQWQANPRGEWMSLVANRGALRLVAQPDSVAGTLWTAPNLLLQKWPAPAFSATTVLDFRARPRRIGGLVTRTDHADRPEEGRDWHATRMAMAKDARNGTAGARWRATMATARASTCA